MAGRGRGELRTRNLNVASRCLKQVQDEAILEQKRREAKEAERRRAEEQALAEQREKERREKEERERRDREEKERIEAEKREKLAIRAGYGGVRGVRGTRASAAKARGAAVARGTVLIAFRLFSLLNLTDSIWASRSWTIIC